jgi:hypothetical protein
VRLLAGLLIAFALAAGLGLWATWIALEHPPSFGALRSGPWTAFPDKGGLQADPYERAIVARSGEAPLPAGDAVVLTATRDSDGRRLRGTCDYQIRGEVPASRFWSVSLSDPLGDVLANPGDRYGLSSTEMVHDEGQPWVVDLTPQAHPGNWLPTPRSGPFTLALHLYETTGLTQLRAQGQQPMPAIVRGDCR